MAPSLWRGAGTFCDPNPCSQPPLVSGLLLEDDYGVAAHDSLGVGAGQIELQPGDTTEVIVRVLTSAGRMSPERAGIDYLRVECPQPGVLLPEVYPRTAPLRIRLHAVASGETSLRVLFYRGAEVVFTSRWIPAVVAPLPEIVGMDLCPVPSGEICYRSYGYDDESVLLAVNETKEIQVTFLERTTQWVAPIPPDRLGRRAHLEVTGTSTLLSAEPTVEDRFRLRLRGSAPGSIRPGIELWNGGTLVYSAVTPDIVISSPMTWWDGFGTEHGLNGSVQSMAVFQGSLIVAGTFTQAGPDAARHVARWDGQEWSALGEGVASAAMVLADGDVLVAGDLGLGFHRWTGEEWIEDAPAPDSHLGAPTAATLWRGEVVVSGPAGIKAWHDGAWEGLAISSGRPYLLATCQGELVTTVRVHHPMWDSIELQSFDGTETTSLFTASETDWGITVDFTFLDGQGDEVWFGWTECYNSCRYSVERYYRGSHGPLGGSPSRQPNSFHGAATVAGKVYAIDDEAVWVDEGSGFRRAATASPGAILDVASYDGSLYIGGTFDAVDGVPSPNIARWTP